MNDNARKIILALIPPVIILVAWCIATTVSDIPEGILPKISSVIKAYKTMLSSGELWQDLSVSLLRVVKGFLIASVLGVVLGSLMGMFRQVRELLAPVITVIRQIPIIAWIPLIILWSGIGEISKVIIIAMAAFFQVLVNTENGIETTPESLVEVAKLYKLNPWQTFTKVYLPHAIPHILVGLRLGLSVSWMAVVAAEMIAATSGIGYKLSYARSLMEADVVISCMIVIGLVGIMMDKLIGYLLGLTTPWIKFERKGK